MATYHEIFEACYLNWMAIQELDLEKLLNATASTSGGGGDPQEALRALIAMNLSNYENYAESRTTMARIDPLTLYSPPWCSSFEKANLWIGGSRPTLSVRMIYAISGHEVTDDGHLVQSGSGVLRGGLEDISADQVAMLRDLQGRTVLAEEELSRRLAARQNSVANRVMLQLEEDNVDGGKEELERKAGAFGELLMAADRLRLSNLRELLHRILTPKQGVEMLIAAKKLALKVHEFGKLRDEDIMGRK